MADVEQSRQPVLPPTRQPRAPGGRPGPKKFRKPGIKNRPIRSPLQVAFGRTRSGSATAFVTLASRLGESEQLRLNSRENANAQEPMEARHGSRCAKPCPLRRCHRVPKLEGWPMILNDPGLQRFPNCKHYIEEFLSNKSKFIPVSQSVQRVRS